MRLLRRSTPVLAAALAAGALATPAAAQDAATTRMRLERDTVIDGVPCASTGRAFAEVHSPGGRLAECPLASATSIAGHDLPAGTWIVLHPDGRLRMAWLPHDTRIGHVVCKGTGYKDWVTEFHDDGSLRMCFMPERTVIDGIPCRAGTIWGELTGGVAVRFHPDGRLASCSLARATTIEGTRHPTRTRIHIPRR